MDEKIMLGDFIFQLRKQKGLSQAELGELVGVSNKAVSKWETNEANPDLRIISALAQALDVTTDELLACKRNQSPKQTQDHAQPEYKSSQLFSIKGKEFNSVDRYEFVSDKRTSKGRPYLHIHLGKKPSNILKCTANGVIAIGLRANGIVSIGVFCSGIISIGVFAIGLLTFGPFAFGFLFASGAVAVSAGVAVGAMALGTIAIGAVAVGYVSIGAVSIGYYAHTSSTGIAIGTKTIIHRL